MIPLNNRIPREEEVEDEASQGISVFKSFKVAKCEYTRFLIFSLMIGIAGFVYSFMRIIKDTYVIVRQNPICIAYIKLFYILPISIVFVLVINLMLSTRSLSRIFSIFTLMFAGLFALFAVLILAEDKIFFDPIHIQSLIAVSELEMRGLGFAKDFLLTINQLLATLIFITAEMWGTMILSYLFLSFLNESCTRSQHARLLPPLLVIATLFQLFSALVTTGFFKIRERLSFEQNKLMMAFVFLTASFLSLIILFCKYYLETRLFSRPVFRPKTKNTALLQSSSSAKDKSKGKGSASFSESLEVMSQSKFLLAMCLIVFFYSFIYNVLETIYKNGLTKGAAAAKEEKGKYSGKFNNLDQYSTSILVLVLSFTSFSNLDRRTGWKTVALISPLIAGISVIAILGMAIYNAGCNDDSIKPINKVFSGMTQFIVFENYLGMFCISFMKVFKYTAFDVAKEKISMRIADGYRPKFKSIYDGIFNKMGKSGGAVFSIIIDAVGSTIDLRGMSPITSIFMVPSIVAWIFSVAYLSRRYDKSVEEDSNIDIDIVEEEEEEEEEKSEEPKVVPSPVIEEDQKRVAVSDVQ